MHFLIGLLAGLVLARHLQATTLPAPLGRLRLETVPAPLLVATSALLASWPDLLDPDSWLSPVRLRWSTLLAGVSMAVLGWAWTAGRAWPPWPLAASWPWLAASAALFALLGITAGPRLGRIASTFAQQRNAAAWAESVISALLLGGVAAALAPVEHVSALAALPLLLAWGIVLHLPGAALSSRGLVPLFPLTRLRLRCPPAREAWVEAALTIVALGVVLWLSVAG